MATCLITGCAGFIGSHLAEHLVKNNHDVFGTVFSRLENIQPSEDVMTVVPMDITNKQDLEESLKTIKPDWVFHLAAQSLPGLSWRDPELTFNVNILGTLFLLDGIRKAGLDPMILMLCSSGGYAPANSGAPPIGEDHRLEPSSPYALSKVAQDHLSLLYWKAYKLRIIRVRPFCIIGPRKIGDVSSDFARGIVAVERGERHQLEVGNLEAVRDFVDVRDAVVALEMLAEQGEEGEAYNVCTGVGHSVREVLDILLAHAHKPVAVCPDPSRFRPVEEPFKVGNCAKLLQLGWRPSIPFEQSLNDILTSCRNT